MPNKDGGWLLPDDLDPPRRCLQVHIPWNLEYRAAWTGAIYELTRWFNWHRDDAKRGRLAAAVWAEVFRDMIDMMDSDNPCPCEGEFMTDCCDPILEKLDIIIGLIQASGGQPSGIEVADKLDMIRDVVKAAEFSPLDLHAKAPLETYTGNVPAELDDRTQALCYVLTQVMVGIAREYGVMFSALMIGAPAVALTNPAAWGFWWVALGGFLMGLAGGLISDAILRDEQAVKNVVCCMSDYLVGKDLTREMFQQATLNCQPGGNETLIAGALYHWADDDANFGALVHDLGQAFDLIEGGADLYCPCQNEGVSCDPGGTYSQFEYDYDGGSGWAPDAIAGACQNFGHVLSGGGTYSQTTTRCIRLAQLNRFFGGTSSNEATLARWEINGHVQYVPIVAGEHCTVAFDPPQTIGPGSDLRVDLIGGGGIMCYTGFITQMATPA